MTLTAPPAGQAGPAGAPRFAPEAPSGTARLFRAASPALADHRAAYGPLPVLHGNDLVRALQDSGLDGRGGAGFPVWRKIESTRRSAARAGAKSPVVIANGSEGEPLSRKDETLLLRAPHLVIDGLLLAAAAVEAADGGTAAAGTPARASALHLYVSAATGASVRAALAERTDARRISLVVAPDGFVVGEATAVANAIERGISVPRDHPLHLSESGVGKRPTLVQNVETLAQLALIARFGPEWFRSVGTPDEPGTRLVTVSSDGAPGSGVAAGAPGQVFEVAGGTPVSAILTAAGVAPGDLAAVLVGGYHGAWLPAGGFDTGFSREGLRMFGAAPGAGVLFALGAGRCGLEVSSGIAAYLAAQTAGSCGPCVNGLPALAGVLGRLAASPGSSGEARGHGGARPAESSLPADGGPGASSHRQAAAWPAAVVRPDPGLPAEVARLADLVTGRGACSHPDGTARFVLSALTVFEADVRAHLAGTCEVHRGRA